MDEPAAEQPVDAPQGSFGATDGPVLIEPQPPPPQAIPPGPVGEGERIHALDAIRGFALLGILLVNIQAFGEPFGKFLEPEPAEGASALDAALFYFVKIFCEGKFYPLFALLFGAGLVLQTARMQAGGRGWFGTYLRRLGMLAIIGLLHATLLWYGDILFMYSVCGVVLLLCSRARARKLFIAGVILVLFSALTTAAITAMVFAQDDSVPPTHNAPAPAAAGEAEVGSAADETLDASAPPDGDVPPDGAALPDDDASEPDADDLSLAEPPAPDALPPPETRPFQRLWRVLSRGDDVDPTSPLWIETETAALRDGPFTQATLFRLLSFALTFGFGLTSWGWHVVGMFFIGAALTRWGLFTPQRRNWHIGFVIAALMIGVPVAALAARIPHFDWGTPGYIAVPVLQMVGGPVLSVGYLGAIALIAGSGRARRATAALANVGRMGLTNYLLQTVIATAIFYHWGLGLLGETTRPQRIALVFAIYLAQVILSALWLRAFRYGPIEWLWRSFTYLRPQPMRRGATIDDA